MAASGSGGGAAPPFSIRGYAARARAGAADEGDRCWPLGGEAGPLPPIEVRRFRWWADEAAVAKELVVEEEEEEERRKAAMCRKRSVVELFAAVPRVAGGGEERRVRRKLDKGKLAAGVLTKKGSKKDKAPPERKKERSGNVKAVSLSISQLFQDAIQKRKLKNSHSKKRKNEEVSVLLSKKTIKGSKKSVLSNQKVMKNNSEVQTILKKHLRTGEGAFLKNSDATCLSKSSLRSKHVSFSDADNICELTASHPKGDTEQSQVLQTSLQPSGRDDSQVVADQRNTDEPLLVHQRIDAISEIVEEDSSSLSEKVGSTGASHTVPLTNSKGKNTPRNSMDLNHCIEISRRGNGNRLSSISSVALSSQGLTQKFVDVDFPLQEGLYLGIGRQAERMIPQGSSTPAGLALDPRPGHLMRILLPQPSSSCYVASLKEASDRNRSTILQERLIANCHLTEHPSVLRSGNDMVSSINTSTGSNKSTAAQTTDSVSACRSMPFGGGYMSLPLNSHGEFVRVQPGGTFNPDELLKRQSLGKDSLHPSASPTFVTPNTCLDYSHLRINNQGQAPPFFTVANFGIQPDPYFTPKLPTAYCMDFRQCPSSERMEVHNYAIPSSNYSGSNQQESSGHCSCAQCLGHDNQLHKSLEMQSCFPRQNYEQNIQPAVDTTMRLMGKTVNLGTGSKQCGGLDNWVPCSSKQIRAEDHYFPGMRTQTFPQLFHGGPVDLPSRFGISNGGRPPSEYVSCFSSAPAAAQGSVPCFSSVPAAEQGCAFSQSNHSQQPQLAVPNKVSGQPVSRYSEVGLGHQRPAVANQVQRVHSAANHLQPGGCLQPGAVDYGRTPSVAAMSYYDPWDKFKTFVETTPRPSQSSFFPRNGSNMAQRAPASRIMPGYSIQSTPALTTPTKFTSLRPLPPSMVSSHVYSSEGAQPNGSTQFHPPAPLSSQPGKVNAPGGAIFKDRSMKQAPTGANVESSKQMDKSFKRPAAGKDNVLLTLAKKPSTAVGKNRNLSPLPEKGIDLRGSRPYGQPLYTPFRVSSEPDKNNLRAVNNDTPTCSAWTESVNSVGAGPVQLKSGAKHILQPCASASMDQEDSWPVHSVVPFEAENDSRTVRTVVGSSKKTDLC